MTWGNVPQHPPLCLLPLPHLVVWLRYGLRFLRELRELFRRHRLGHGRPPQVATRETVHHCQKCCLLCFSQCLRTDGVGVAKTTIGHRACWRGGAFRHDCVEVGHRVLHNVLPVLAMQVTDVHGNLNTRAGGRIAHLHGRVDHPLLVLACQFTPILSSCLRHELLHAPTPTRSQIACGLGGVVCCGRLLVLLSFLLLALQVVVVVVVGADHRWSSASKRRRYPTTADGKCASGTKHHWWAGDRGKLGTRCD